MKYLETVIDAIVEEYPNFDTPSDQLPTKPETLAAFAQAVNARAGSDLSDAEVFQATVHARKLGLLPRLRRAG